jgi:regulator of sigma E protease
MIETPGFFWTILFFLLAIGPLVFVHEMGHYLVGRWCGVKADVFSIGFGQEITGWTDKQGTRWKIGWMPLGGYVRFAGDMSATSQPSEEWKALPEAERNQTFQAKALWQRALIIVAGPATNFLMAIAIFMGIFAVYGQLRTSNAVGAVVAGSPAEKAGFAIGDKILAVDDSPISEFGEISDIVALRPGIMMSFLIERNGADKRILAVPALKIIKDRFGNEIRLGQIGLGSGKPVAVRLSPFELPAAAVMQTVRVVKSMVDGLVQIVMGRISVKELGGPIKIAQYSGQTATLGFVAFIGFVALISINLGFINLLPIPTLDGGHLFFYGVEAVTRRPVSMVVQEWAYRSGFFALMALMLFVTFNDLASFGLWNRLSGLIG